MKMMETPNEFMQLEMDQSVLKELKRLGFSPSCIYDIGAGHGIWTRLSAEVFPETCFEMFEPLADVNPIYQQGLEETLKSEINCTLHKFALGTTAGEFKIGISPDPRGSSLLVERESSHFPESAVVPVMALDEAMRSLNLPQPNLLKMDTQGFEWEILKGAIETLKQVDVILVEGWLTREYGPRTPLLMEIALWLANHGFFLFDFSGRYRLSSGVLASQDAFFVKFPSTCETLNQDRFFTPEGTHERIALPKTQAELQGTHTELQRTQLELQNVYTQLQKTQAELQKTQAELQGTQTELQNVQTSFHQSQNEVEAMKTSKFWKIRRAWFSVKGLLGRSS